MSWIAVGLAGTSLLTSVTTLYVVLKVLRSAHRAERAGDERLEILREQQQRLQVLYQERRMFKEELEWWRSKMDGEGHRLELNAPTESNGHSGPERVRAHPWWRRIIGG